MRIERASERERGWLSMFYYLYKIKHSKDGVDDESQDGLSRLGNGHDGDIRRNNIAVAQVV